MFFTRELESKWLIRNISYMDIFGKLLDTKTMPLAMSNLQNDTTLSYQHSELQLDLKIWFFKSNLWLSNTRVLHDLETLWKHFMLIAVPLLILPVSKFILVSPNGSSKNDSSSTSSTSVLLHKAEFPSSRLIKQWSLQPEFPVISSWFLTKFSFYWEKWIFGMILWIFKCS